MLLSILRHFQSEGFFSHWLLVPAPSLLADGYRRGVFSAYWGFQGKSSSQWVHDLGFSQASRNFSPPLLTYQVFRRQSLSSTRRSQVELRQFVLSNISIFFLWNSRITIGMSDFPFMRGNGCRVRPCNNIFGWPIRLRRGGRLNKGPHICQDFWSNEEFARCYSYVNATTKDRQLKSSFFASNWQGHVFRFIFTLSFLLFLSAIKPWAWVKARGTC